MDNVADNQIHVYNASEQPNLWLNKVGWAHHLEGLDAAALYQLTQPKPNDTAVLVTILDSVERVLNNAQRVAMSLTPSNSILYLLERQRVVGVQDTGRSDHAFQAHLEEPTVDSYIGVMVKIVRVIFSMQALGQNVRPPYNMDASVNEIMVWLQDNAVPVTALESIDARVTKLLFSLFCQPIETDTYDCVLISALAVCALQADGGFAPPKHYTPVYAAVVKAVRWLILADSKAEAAADVTRTKHFYDLVETKMNSFMTSPKYPMDWIYNMLAYGKAIAQQTGPENNISWDDNTITYNATRFSMDELRGFIKGLVKQARINLFGLLLFDVDPNSDELPALPKIPWETSLDNNGELDVNHSFLKEPGNPWAKQHAEFIWGRLRSSRVLQGEWLNANGNGVDTFDFDPATITKYAQQLDSFRELLLVLMHLTAGQPARSTELINLRYKNTKNGVRNIFLESGLVCILTTYHKNIMQANAIKLIYRYLPREVGDLLVRYLSMVLPFWSCIQSSKTGNKVRSPYLWASDVVIDELSKPTFWSNERLSHALARLFKEHMDVKMNVSSWRQIAVAICDQYLRKFDAAGIEEDDLFTIQCGHSAWAEGINYARLVGQMNVGTRSQREGFRKKSMLWHAFLDFAPATVAAKRYCDEISNQYQEARVSRLKDLSMSTYDEILLYLRRVCDNPAATFKGNQQAVLEKIITDPLSHVLQVASTGAGKSLSFMLPARMCRQGKTVVIVPLVALRSDLFQRCVKAGITTQEWKAEATIDPTATIVLVTPESFLTNSFASYLHGLVEQHKLDRIVVDECHTFLDCGQEFRPTMHEIGKAIKKWHVQSIFLTATLPPCNFDAFLTWSRIDRSHLHYFHGDTSRPNIKYSVQKVDSLEQRVESVTRLIAELQLEFGEVDARFVVFVRRVADGPALSDALNCSFYHSKSGTTREKENMFAEWVGNNNGRVIVATCALGHGLDIPNIRGVVHAGMPNFIPPTKLFVFT
jgi:DEAD/DEAH box helicase